MKSAHQRNAASSNKSTLSTSPRRRPLWTSVAMVALPMIVWIKLSTSWGSSLMNSNFSLDAIDRELVANATTSYSVLLSQMMASPTADDESTEVGDGARLDENNLRQVEDTRRPMEHVKTADERGVEQAKLSDRIDDTELDSSNRGGGSKLRLDWSNLELKTDLAKEIHQHMRNCSIPRADYKWRIHRGTGHNYGLGSELHTFQTILVHGMDEGYRPQAVGHWDWYDKQACNGSRTTLACYFPDLEPECPNDVVLTDINTEKPGCLNLGTKRFYGHSQNSAQRLRPALTEVMFSSVSPLVLSEADRQLHKVFPNGIVPPNLITVHVRWGDKVNEMALLEMQEYLDKIKEMVAKHKLSDVNILLCTEDPVAVDAFKKIAPPAWRIYLDQFYVEYAPYRGNSTYNVASNVSVSLDGKAGLWALASALVAAEADYYVLTIKSNWSRLINELRQIVEARMNTTTYMTNLGKDYDC